jgi:hypothetical protein
VLNSSLLQLTAHIVKRSPTRPISERLAAHARCCKKVRASKYLCAQGKNNNSTLFSRHPSKEIRTIPFLCCQDQDEDEISGASQIENGLFSMRHDGTWPYLDNS